MSKWLFVAIVLVGIGTYAMAQETEQKVTKEQALAWIDRFSVDQVLFHTKDVEKLRERVAAMSDEEVQKWWTDTAVRRELLDSPEWADTRAWLKEFLSVQAIYSEDEIKYFQSENFVRAQESPRELKDVMAEINALRRRLRQGAEASASTRKTVLASQQAFQQQAVRQREAATLQLSPPPAANAGQVRRAPRARYNEPLVTSLDAARWSIIRDVFPRW